MLNQRNAWSRYCESLNAVERVTAEEERKLSERWKKGDQRAGTLLVESCLPFVIRIAREYRRWGIPLEDLVQQGNLGLLRAATKFDPEKECRLVTYAAYWIRAEIRDYVVRNYRIVRLGTTRTERKAVRSFRTREYANVEELAEESGMPLARAEKLWPLLSAHDASLDATVADRPAAIDRLADRVETPEETFAHSEFMEIVRDQLDVALDNLSDRERRIVSCRLMSDSPRTLEALGKEMGVSKERVRQLESRARVKLRESLATIAHIAA